MAQVTVSLTSEQEEELESVEDISDSDTVVGRILEEDEDGQRSKENWRKLVRKLSNKRKRKGSAGRGKTAGQEDKEEREDKEEDKEEDNIPEDWRPDFIPRDWEVARQTQQPDLVQTSQPPPSAGVKFRSDHRRYLQREMGRMKRNSLAAEIVPEEEEEEEEEDRLRLEQPYIRPRLTM